MRACCMAAAMACCMATAAGSVEPKFDDAFLFDITQLGHADGEAALLASAAPIHIVIGQARANGAGALSTQWPAPRGLVRRWTLGTIRCRSSARTTSSGEK